MNLVCIHGNSLDHSVFESIKVDGFKNHALNLPGHGNRKIGSVKNFSDLVDVVFEEIKSLEDVVLLGTSLGGHIAHHLLAKMNPLAIITIAAPPLELSTVAQAFAPNPIGHLLFQANINSESANELAESMLSLRKDKVNLLSNMILNTNPMIRDIIGKSLAGAEFSNEVELLTNFLGKKILIIPENDGIINRDYIRSLTIAQVFELAGNHMLTMDNPEELNILLNRELSEFRK